jgi:hypothetical protein
MRVGIRPTRQKSAERLRSGALSSVAWNAWFGALSIIKPVIGQQCCQSGLLALWQENAAAKVPPVNLCYHLAAAAAGRTQNAVPSNRDNGCDVRFALLKHLCDCGHFGAESETAGKVDADTRVYISVYSLDCGTDGSGREILALA